jgi:hypothetical protein
MSFLDATEYLKQGTASQQEAFSILERHKILQLLAEFDPILVGTIPLAINVPGSDLDIACECKDLKGFIQKVYEHFSHLPAFSVAITSINSIPTVLAHFQAGNYPVEIFAQNVPVRQQSGYLHMIKEYEILQHEGAAFREQILQLKYSGLKTEPAFAQLLNLEGDPYLSLLKYHRQ